VKRFAVRLDYLFPLPGEQLLDRGKQILLLHGQIGRSCAAETGVRAIAIAQRTVIHAGILDVHMPGLTGIETCRRLHRLVGRLPLILMSGAANEGLRLDALSAGAATFLPKPLDLRVLLRTLEELVRVSDFPGDMDF